MRLILWFDPPHEPRPIRLRVRQNPLGKIRELLRKSHCTKHPITVRHHYVCTRVSTGPSRDYTQKWCLPDKEHAHASWAELWDELGAELGKARLRWVRDKGACSEAASDSPFVESREERGTSLLPKWPNREQTWKGWCRRQDTNNFLLGWGSWGGESLYNFKGSTKGLSWQRVIKVCSGWREYRGDKDTNVRLILDVLTVLECGGSPEEFQEKRGYR